jgi:hypothetical protein
MCFLLHRPLSALCPCHCCNRATPSDRRTVVAYCTALPSRITDVGPATASRLYTITMASPKCMLTASSYHGHPRGDGQTRLHMLSPSKTYPPIFPTQSSFPRQLHEEEEPTSLESSIFISLFAMLPPFPQCSSSSATAQPPICTTSTFTQPSSSPHARPCARL